MSSGWAALFSFFLSFAWGPISWAENPINLIEADYVCHLESGKNLVAFRLAAQKRAPRLWLGMKNNRRGLEVDVQSFTFKSCSGCYQMQGRYSFTGGINLSYVETQAKISDAPEWPAGEWPPPAPTSPVDQNQGPIQVPPPGGDSYFLPQNIDCDLPPGAELPPECGGDKPPGQGGGEQPQEPTEPEPPPATPIGPPLHIRYYESSDDGRRILFQGLGTCEGQALGKSQSRQH